MPQPTHQHQIVVYALAGLALSALVAAMVTQQPLLLLPFLVFALVAGFYHHHRVERAAPLAISDPTTTVASSSMHASHHTAPVTAPPREPAYRGALQAQGLVEERMPADGNCFFHAIAAQHRDPEGHPVPHATLRSLAATHLSEHSESFVDSGENTLANVHAEASELKKDRIWTGELGGVAMAQALGVLIVVHSDRMVTMTGDDGERRTQAQPPRLYRPSSIKDTTPVYQVVFVNGNHYNLVQWAEDTSASTIQAFETAMRQKAREVTDATTSSSPRTPPAIGGGTT